MIDPLIALIIGLVIIFILSLIFFPKIGVASRIKKLSQDSERIQIEDAL